MCVCSAIWFPKKEEKCKEKFAGKPKTLNLRSSFSLLSFVAADFRQFSACNFHMFFSWNLHITVVDEHYYVRRMPDDNSPTYCRLEKQQTVIHHCSHDLRLMTSRLMFLLFNQQTDELWWFAFLRFVSRLIKSIDSIACYFVFSSHPWWLAKTNPNPIDYR